MPAYAQSGLRVPQRGEPGLDPALARGGLAAVDPDRVGFATYSWREAVGLAPGTYKREDLSLDKVLIVGPGGGAAPALDLLDDRLEAGGEGGVTAPLQGTEEPAHPEVLAVRVPRLRHAVGIEHEPVPRPQDHRLLPEAAGAHADREPGGVHLDGRFALGQVNRPGVRVARRIADRVVYGGRASSYEVLTGFTGQIGDTYSTEDVLARMAQVLAEGTGAASASVRLDPLACRRLISRLRGHKQGSARPPGSMSGSSV